MVTATDQYAGDVLIEGEKVTTIGSSLTMQADRVIDATDRYVMPEQIASVSGDELHLAVSRDDLVKRHSDVAPGLESGADRAVCTSAADRASEAATASVATTAARASASNAVINVPT